MSNVIPACYVGRTIGPTLAAALAQGYGGNIDIIVGDVSDNLGARELI